MTDTAPDEPVVSVPERLVKAAIEAADDAWLAEGLEACLPWGPDPEAVDAR